MRISLREAFRSSKLVIFTLMLCSILIVSAYAIFYLWSASATVTISTFSPYIKVYLGPQEVTSINFGNLVPGSSVYMDLTIKNTHPNATFWPIYWDSTLASVTNKITDSWFAGGITLNPGQSRSYHYRIMVASDCPLGTYSWTLYLHGTV